jgi:tetratricopeptide (TPR) repeat protein
MIIHRAIAAACLCAVLAAHPSAQARRHEVRGLNDAGWKAVQGRDGDRAAALFAEALSIQPNDAVLLLGAGVAAQMRGRTSDAVSYLQKSVKADPALVDASMLLGELAYQEGDIDLAIRTYEAALKRRPQDSRLTERLEQWRREAEAHRGFEEIRYDRFRVMFEGRADQALATRATSVLDNAFWRIGQTLGSFPSQPVIVVLYTEQQFRDVTNLPEWAAAGYDGRVRMPVRGALNDPAAFERVLVHELTHALVTHIAPHGIPTWLHEGLAQHFEGEDANAAARRVAARGRIPLKHLEGDFSRMTAAQAQVAYDESLLAVRVLAARPGFGWHNLLSDLSRGQSFAEAIQRFGFTYEDLEAAFR